MEQWLIFFDLNVIFFFSADSIYYERVGRQTQKQWWEWNDIRSLAKPLCFVELLISEAGLDWTWTPQTEEFAAAVCWLQFKKPSKILDLVWFVVFKNTTENFFFSSIAWNMSFAPNILKIFKKLSKIQSHSSTSTNI